MKRKLDWIVWVLLATIVVWMVACGLMLVVISDTEFEGELRPGGRPQASEAGEVRMAEMSDTLIVTEVKGG